jgi:hypothetical protein
MISTFIKTKSMKPSPAAIDRDLDCESQLRASIQKLFSTEAVAEILRWGKRPLRPMCSLEGARSCGRLRKASRASGDQDQGEKAVIEWQAELSGKCRAVSIAAGRV